MNVPVGSGYLPNWVSVLHWRVMGLVPVLGKLSFICRSGILDFRGRLEDLDGRVNEVCSAVGLEHIVNLSWRSIESCRWVSISSLVSVVIAKVGMLGHDLLVSCRKWLLSS